VNGALARLDTTAADAAGTLKVCSFIVDGLQSKHDKVLEDELRLSFEHLKPAGMTLGTKTMRDELEGCIAELRKVDGETWSALLPLAKDQSPVLRQTLRDKLTRYDTALTAAIRAAAVLFGATQALTRPDLVERLKGTGVGGDNGRESQNSPHPSEPEAGKNPDSAR
jgi:hypothetical protein